MAKDQIAKFLADRLRNNNRLIRQHVSPEDLERYLAGAVNSWFDMKAEEQKRLAASSREEETIRQRKFYREQFALTAELMTGLWRLDKKLADSTPGISPENHSALGYFTGQIWNSLRAAGYRVGDIPEKLAGAPDIKITAFEFHPDQVEDQVVEMVRPILYHKNYCIQTGEAIVATASQKDNPL